MHEVKVKKTELLEKLNANRAKHEDIFKEACDGYTAEATRLLEEHLEQVRSGKMRRVAVMLPYPENHLKDYDRIITMVEMCVDSEIELDAGQFAQFVMDDWQWKRQFLTSNSSYSGTARAMSGEFES